MSVDDNEINLRNDLPMIFCNNTEERNEKIYLELNYLHNNEYSALVVFNDYKENEKKFNI